MTQYDLPPQAILQQSAARPISGEELETYGKHASSLYSSGEAPTLNEAVITTVKSAGLSPEQVRRVCEFANTAAFLHEFSKEGAASKYVVFSGGPADFSEVLKDLNSGGGGTVFDRGMADYARTPDQIKSAASFLVTENRRTLEKVAGVQINQDTASDLILKEAFSVDLKASFDVPYSRPLEDVETMREKLSSAKDTLESEINTREVDLLDCTEKLYQQVKQASMSGVPLGHVVHAWYQAMYPGPNPSLVKAAFAQMGPRLKDEGVFDSWNNLWSSLEKTAAASAIVDNSHPIVSCFSDYCELVTKLAELRAASCEVASGISQLDTFTRSLHRHYPEI